MNPKIYCLRHGMTTADFIAKAKAVAPKYSKVAHSMASNPAYGVALRASVANAIAPRKERRQLPCRLSFRCTEAGLTRLMAARDKLSFTTNQDLLAFIVNRFLDEMDEGTKEMWRYDV